jgi:hypothetical protein
MDLEAEAIDSETAPKSLGEVMGLDHRRNRSWRAVALVDARLGRHVLPLAWTAIRQPPLGSLGYLTRFVMAQQTSTKRRKNLTADTTRVELLRAGYEMLCEEGFDSTLHLRLTEVTKRAGRTTGAAYQIWPRQHLYHRDLAEYVLEQASASTADVAIATIADLDSDATLEAALAATAQACVEEDRGDRMFQAFIRYWPVAQTDDVISTALRDGFARHRAQFDALCAGLLERFGLEPRPPYRLEDLGCAVGATTDGFTLWWGINRPDRGEQHNGRDAYAVLTGSLVAIFTAMTRKARNRR